MNEFIIVTRSHFQLNLNAPLNPSPIPQTSYCRMLELLRLWTWDVLWMSLTGEGDRPGAHKQCSSRAGSPQRTASGRARESAWGQPAPPRGTQEGASAAAGPPPRPCGKEGRKTLAEADCESSLRLTLTDASERVKRSLHGEHSAVGAETRDGAHGGTQPR